MDIDGENSPSGSWVQLQELFRILHSRNLVHCFLIQPVTAVVKEKVKLLIVPGACSSS